MDYHGNDVNAGTVLQVLTGRVRAGTPASKRLDSGRGSNVLLYYAGHAGDGFLKFQVRQPKHLHEAHRLTLRGSFPPGSPSWPPSPTGNGHCRPPNCETPRNGTLVCTILYSLAVWSAQDVDELSSTELRAALWEMRAKGRYRQLLLVLDTCEAQSMFVAPEFDVPDVIAVGSSSVGENSYAYGIDDEVRAGGRAAIARRGRGFACEPLLLHTLSSNR